MKDDGGFDWTRSSGLKIRSTLAEADGDINSRHIRRGGEYRSCSSYTEDENITRPRYPKYPSTSSLSQVSDSICTKSSITMVYICPRCYSTQLESCAAQMCNVLAGVLGGVVLVLWVVVLAGLVCALLASVRVPHFPRCRCCMYLELSVIIVLPNLFLLLTQWLC